VNGLKVSNRERERERERETGFLNSKLPEDTNVKGIKKCRRSLTASYAYFFLKCIH
jgi:hypothetical protein